ncbi:MAG TPA: hypothetical protein VFJ76_07825 [Solirubrobacterales bacterium]|nr:hypothetical protein [Solirubrobacterales bacterium]
MRETGTKEWKVLDVREGKTEPNPHGGEFQKFYVDFEGSDDTYWRRRKGDAPEVGKSYYGTISEGNYGPMFKKEKRPEGSSEASTGGGGSKREWKPESQYDPEKVARITRAHAQKMALEWAALLQQSPGPLTLTLPNIFQLADAFQHDIETNGQAAIQGAGAGATSSAQASSPATAPAPESRPTEGLADLEMALNETPSGSFMGAEARALVAKYMQTQLAPDDLTRACNQLTNKGDQEQQEMTFRAMCKRTEKWKGQPLPTAPQPDDDIPF